MNRPSREDAIAAAKNVAGSANRVADELRRLRIYGRINRALIYAVGALAIAVAVIAVIAFNASSSASKNQAANIAACRASNQTRAQQAGLWNYLIGISRPPATATPAQKAADEKALADIKAHVAATFKPRDCIRTYG